MTKIYTVIITGNGFMKINSIQHQGPDWLNRAKQHDSAISNDLLNYAQVHALAVGINSDNSILNPCELCVSLHSYIFYLLHKDLCNTCSPQRIKVMCGINHRLSPQLQFIILPTCYKYILVIYFIRMFQMVTVSQQKCIPIIFSHQFG